MFFAIKCLRMKNIIERFTIECRKTKTKAITMANHNKRKQHNELMRTRSKYTRNRCQARENACVTKSWLVFVLHPIGWEDCARFLNQSQSIVKQNQSNSAITFDTQLKIALKAMLSYNLSSLLLKSFRFMHELMVSGAIEINLRVDQFWCWCFNKKGSCDKYTKQERSLFSIRNYLFSSLFLGPFSVHL